MPVYIVFNIVHSR